MKKWICRVGLVGSSWVLYNLAIARQNFRKVLVKSDRVVDERTKIEYRRDKYELEVLQWHFPAAANPQEATDIFARLVLSTTLCSSELFLWTLLAGCPTQPRNWLSAGPLAAGTKIGPIEITGSPVALSWYVSLSWLLFGEVNFKVEDVDDGVAWKLIQETTYAGAMAGSWLHAAQVFHDRLIMAQCVYKGEAIAARA